MTEILAPMSAEAACEMMGNLTGRHFDPESDCDREAAAAAMEAMLADDAQRELLLERIGAQVLEASQEKDPH